MTVIVLVIIVIAPLMIGPSLPAVVTIVIVVTGIPAARNLNAHFLALSPKSLASDEQLCISTGGSGGVHLAPVWEG